MPLLNGGCESMKFALERINSYLLYKQHLTSRGKSNGLPKIVRDIGGLHATGAMVPYLSLRARSATFAKGELERALYEKRSLGKVLCMRNTLFILPKEFLPVAYQATKKSREALITRYLRYYGLSQEEYKNWMTLILEALGSGPKTAAEIRRDIDGDPGLKVALGIVPNDWRIIRTRPRGSWRSNQYEYVTFDSWFPEVDLESITPAEARRRLIRHYLAALGPATKEDAAWWCGFGKEETETALRALADQVVTISIEGLDQEFIILRNEIESLREWERRGKGEVFLLPSLDPYVMGYKDRRRFLAPEHNKKVFDRAGNALPTIWAESRVIGVWQKKDPRLYSSCCSFGRSAPNT